MQTPADFGLIEGDLAIAVPTSVAFETVLKDSNLYGRIIAVNINTLIRNWLGAIDYQGKLLPKTVGDFIFNEIETIKMVFSQRRCTGIFFFSDLTPLYNRMVMQPYLRKRAQEDIYAGIIATYMMKIHNQFPKPPDKWYPHHGIRYKHTPIEVVMFSHNNLDYLPSNIDLLESHTGKFKEHHQLSDKYALMKNGAGVPVSFERFPFTEELLMLLGTKSLFKVKKPAVRPILLEIAETYDWHPKMTRLKLQAGLSDPKIRTFYESLPPLQKP